MTKADTSRTNDSEKAEGLDDRPVYRTRPLPQGPLQGRFLLPEPMVSETRRALVDTALNGIRDGGHEGLVYWAGCEMESVTAFLSVIVPGSDHGPQHVMVPGPEVTRAARSARAHNMGILAQVHSHPGSDARHSDGDDDLILLPFEGMLSIVAPRYGQDVHTLADLTIHQFQDGRWVLCDDASVERGFEVIPTSIDLRETTEME